MATSRQIEAAEFIAWEIGRANPKERGRLTDALLALTERDTPAPPSDGPLHNHAPIADEVADAILDYGNECGQWAKDPTHPFGRERVAKSLAGLHQRIAAALATKPTPPSDARCDCGKTMEACADTEDCSGQSIGQ